MSNEILLVLLGIAAIVLGLAPEAAGQGGRALRLAGVVLGIIVVLAALLR